MTGLLPGMVSVPQNHVMLIERYGRHVRTVGAGAHWVNPLTSKPHDFRPWNGMMNKEHRFLELSEQFWETTAIRCITQNEIHISLTAKVTFHITNPEKAAYDVDNLPQSMLAACEEAFRNCMAHHTIEELSDIRDELSETVSKNLHERMDHWGVEIHHVAIGDFSYPEKIANELEEKKRLEKEKERLAVSADTRREQAEKQAETSQIEAETEATRLRIQARSLQEREKFAAEQQAEILRIQVDGEASRRLIEAESRAAELRVQAEAKKAAYDMETEAECSRLVQEAAAVGQKEAAQIMAEQKRAELLAAALTTPQNRVIVANESLSLRITDPEALFGDNKSSAN